MKDFDPENRMKNIDTSLKYNRSPLVEGSKWFLSLALITFFLYFILIFHSQSLNDSKKFQIPLTQVEKLIVDNSSIINDKPNFLFILIDDMGYGSIGSDESGIGFAAPFMSNLASNGIKISNYYAQEICTPSRAALMTGRYPITLGMQYGEIQPDDIWGLNKSELLFPQILQQNGYKSYGIGKWNLGHYSSSFLPTARGFDEFIGFLSGEEYHWSKRMPYRPEFVDFFYSNKECYEGYDEDDLHDYSTIFYKEKITNAISKHDFNENPLFLYVAFQAVHYPFNDLDKYPNGLPITYFEDGVYHYFKNKIAGNDRLQYALSLRLVDNAVSEIYQALKEKNQIDNTYIIVTSDNGGCNVAGGRNGDLRGSKGTLFEGGVKVDAFIYSPLFPESSKGKVYTGLMHVSDWFPTILDLANISYIPSEGHELDGLSQKDGFLNGQEFNNRSHILYNLYYNVDSRGFNLSENAPFAIRNSRFKLIHAFENNKHSSWYNFSNPYDSDDDMDPDAGCDQVNSMTGDYTKYLFDLELDPNETNNLYDDDAYASILGDFYNLIYYYADKTREDILPSSSVMNAEIIWESYENYILPWRSDSSSTLSKCSPKNSVFSSIKHQKIP